MKTLEMLREAIGEMSDSAEQKKQMQKDDLDKRIRRLQILGVLVRAGLYDSHQLAKVNRAVLKLLNQETLTLQDRTVLLTILEKLLQMVTDHQNIKQLMKRTLQTEHTGADDFGHLVPGQPPTILLFRRKAFRQYPDQTKVALYYNEKLDRYLSIPYTEGDNVVDI